MEREFEIEPASSAAEAELMMATRDDRVVVCVRLMPGEDGRHFLIHASEGFPHPHRILPAGYMNPGLLTRSIELARFSACRAQAGTSSGNCEGDRRRPVLPLQLAPQVGRGGAAPDFE